MRKAFVIHGAYGKPDENWFPWLHDNLVTLDYDVIIPAFPTPEGQSLKSWLSVFDKYLATLDGETILIGHSLGVPFILSLLELMENKVATCYFVSGFHTLLKHPIDEINKTFVDKEFDWDKIKSNSNKFYMFNGDDDKYIDLSISKDLAKKLNAEYTVIPNGGHLNSTSGYTELPELLNCIKKDN